jgi:mannose-1-phosphate guanylyltransferase / mannose-6-phosphate isomerase
MTFPLIHPVILCGGNGKRLWPVSRKSLPKQFSRLMSDHSMLQATVRRLEDCGCAAPMLMTAQDYRFVVAEQMDEIGLRGHSIVIEPEGRNTAPAIAAAVQLIGAKDEDALILVAPSDHHFADTMALSAAIAAAAESARDGAIVTFGIRPDRPETGYGYIELDCDTAVDGTAVPFVQFIEKPDLSGAQAMMETGRHVWNSGMFLFSVRTMRAALERHQPALVKTVRAAIADGQRDLDFFRLGPAFGQAEDISIDYAVLERETGYVVPMAAGWNDLGSWRTVWQETLRDTAGVGLVGAATALDCTDTLLRSEDPGMCVVGIGLRNVAAVVTKDAVLICDLNSTQAVGEAVRHLKLAKAKQAEDFQRHFRPWGHYETLSLGPRYQVKSIVVKPGGKLSLQSHVHRSEHWVVVEGSATVTIGTSERLIAENQSVYIPLGEVHRLANPGKLPLRLIEVQTGAYLGEDDIVRYEDIYERA